MFVSLPIVMEAYQTNAPLFSIIPNLRKIKLNLWMEGMVGKWILYWV